MPRANRYFIAGHIWHLTHRCHNRHFLLKTHHERQRWLRWAFEARRRYGLCVLDYCITCNHVHLLVRDKGRKGSDTIARSMQLIAGRTAQEYNERKNRHGSFWEDRYHATAVESGKHLCRCIAYIDLNMVRAGAVIDPEDWAYSGYADILGCKKRNRIIDYAEIAKLLKVPSMQALQDKVRNLSQEALSGPGLSRQATWSEAVAVGDEQFMLDMLQELGERAGGRTVQIDSDAFILKEPQTPYGANLAAKIRSIQPDNTRPWNVFDDL